MTDTDTTASPEWVRDATTAIVALAATNQQFTVDDVHQWLATGSEADAPSNAKALGGIMHHLSARLGVIGSVAAWCTSVRHTDRPIRMWVGTSVPHPDITPTEAHVVLALEAIRTVGQERSRLMVESVRKTRGES